MADNVTLFCLVDGQSTLNAFSVEIDSNKTVDGLKDRIRAKKTNDFGDVDADKLTLWKVTIPITKDNEDTPILLKNIPSDKDRLGPATRLSKVFPEELPEETVHIIVQRPPPIPVPVPVHVSAGPSDIIRPGSPVNGIMDVIEQIQSTLILRGRGSDPRPLLSRTMPLQERSMDKALDTVLKNVKTCMSWQEDNQVPKANSSFLVCSGTAGIGKTRYGRELYRALQLRLSEKAKANDVDYAPHFYYMLLDFSKDVKLARTDASLDTETILALRLAYYHFFQGKYFSSFRDFRHQAVEHNELFTVSNVILAICKDLTLNEQRPLFLFLHIDEFQMIFDHRWEGTPKGHRASLPKVGIRLPGDKTECHTPQGLCLFQDMMRTLGDFMSGTFRPHMIQTFLSGTARREVTMAAQPTSYTFEFLSCPTLSLGACYDTMGHFTTLAGVRHCEWMPKMAFLYLLSATDGLPRALELLLEELFGYRLEKCKTFPDALPHIDMNTDQIFRNVANNLNNYYSITAFAQTHQELVRALVRLNIFQQPSPRTLAPSKLFPELTLDVLERDTHTVLEEIDEGEEMVLVRIPFFFLHLYNVAIGEVRNRLGSAFLYNWVVDREWRFFEGMIAEYEALRTNLLIGGGRESATLGDIYRGAIGQAGTLGRMVKLKDLSVVEAEHRFPELGGLMVGEQELDWRSGIVIKNADGAQFGDVCVYREKANDNDDNILCALQAEKQESLLSAATIQSEHNKNTRTIENIPHGSILEQEGIKQARAITVLITTADISDDALRQLERSFPDDCLLIYRRTFNKFFGNAFSVPMALAVSKDFNWNFATLETLKKKHRLGDKEADQILKNMPYRSYADLVEKVPAMGSKKLGEEMGFLPYQDFQPAKRRRLE